MAQNGDKSNGLNYIHNTLLTSMTILLKEWQRVWHKTLKLELCWSSDYIVIMDIQPNQLRRNTKIFVIIYKMKSHVNYAGSVKIITLSPVVPPTQIPHKASS